MSVYMQVDHNAGEQAKNTSAEDVFNEFSSDEFFTDEDGITLFVIRDVNFTSVTSKKTININESVVVVVADTYNYDNIGYVYTPKEFIDTYGELGDETFFRPLYTGEEWVVTFTEEG